MFLCDVPPITYANPWDTPVATRLAALKAGQRRVVYFYENPDRGVFRYRVYNMIQALGSGAAYFSAAELDSFAQAAESADVIVLCRSRHSAALADIVTRARGAGKKVFFDIDDLVFDPAYVPLLLHNLGQTYRRPQVWDRWFAYTGRIGALMRLCDGAIATNDYLAARITESTGLPAAVIPNFLNREQMEISAALFGKKQATGFARSDKIHIGYFSGSPTHNHDFEIAAPALARLLDRDPRVVLSLVGLLDLKGPLANYAARCEFHPLTDWLNLQRLMARVEFNLAPLQDNVFTNCKSELKYFEAAIVGTLTVATPVYAFAKAMAGRTGLLANSYEWDERLGAAIETLPDYPSRAINAQIHAGQNYAWSRQRGLIEQTLFS
jgi:glycosyltransferase involved in cell wall biosynthesis